MLRDLSLTLRQEPESQLPLTRNEECVKITDVLDLSEYLVTFLDLENISFLHRIIPKNIQKCIARYLLDNSDLIACTVITTGDK